MKILVLGSSGLIGSALLAQLYKTNATVLAPTSAEFDFKRPASWQPWLEQADAIVNCVGVMSTQKEQMQLLQCDAPKQIYQQAQQLGVAYVLQLSALGADEAASAVFLSSKGQLDAWLLRSGLRAGVLRPSLVFAVQGRSSQLFVQLAKQGHVLLPRAGQTSIQPVCLNDVVGGLLQMLQQQHTGVVNAVGGEVVSLAAYLGLLRQGAWHQTPAKIHALPVALAKSVAALWQYANGGLVTPDSVDMLLQTRLVPVADFVQVLGRRPLTPAQFVQAAFEGVQHG